MTRHGTHVGLNWHNRTGVPHCDECKEFRRRYMAERRRATSSLTRVAFPLELSDPVVDGLGVAVARSIRESA